MQVTSLFWLRNAPVLGRSNAALPSRVEKPEACRNSDVAAAEDGCTPARDFLFTPHASRITF